MDTSKLLDALTDLRDKREVIDKAISSLEATLELLDGAHQHQLSLPTPEPDHPIQSAGRRRRSKKSYIEHAIDILSTVDHMHIEEILRRIAALVGHAVSRGTVDGGISREIRERGSASRFERVAPGEYRLRKGAEKLASVA